MAGDVSPVPMFRPPRRGLSFRSLLRFPSYFNASLRRSFQVNLKGCCNTERLPPQRCSTGGRQCLPPKTIFFRPPKDRTLICNCTLLWIVLKICFTGKYLQFLDAIASPSTYPCQSVGEWVSESFIISDLEIAIASPSFPNLFTLYFLKLFLRFILLLSRSLYVGGYRSHICCCAEIFVNYFWAEIFVNILCVISLLK